MDEISTLSRKVDALSLEIKAIKDAIIGNEFTDGEGLLKVQRDHDERITALERVKDKVIWMAIGAGVAGGMTVSKIISVVTEHFAK